MKKLLKVFSLLLVPLLLAGIAALLLLATEPGTRWLLERGVALTQGQLRIGAVHGNALGPLRLDDIEYRTPAGTLTLQRLAVDWRPTALLYDILDISVVKTQGLRWRPSQTANCHATLDRLAGYQTALAHLHPARGSAGQ